MTRDHGDAILGAAAEDDHCPLLERAFELDVGEDAYEIENVEGTIPDYLRGTYYLNGPARFARGAVRYRNWLDGDGMVCSLRLEGGRGFVTHRYVASTKHRAEEQAGRAIYRTFGTTFDGDQLIRGIALASPVNVSVYPYAGTLLAFGEQGLPWELDAETLETRGEYNFGGRLNAISPFSAHPHVDPESGELYNFGISFSVRQPVLHLYRFDGAGTLIYRRRLPLSDPCSIHDFALSSRHVVVYLSPYLLDMTRLMQGETLLESLRWQPERGSKLLIASRADGAHVADVEVGAKYCLHLVNSFEAGGRLVVDVVELDQPVYDQYELPDLFPQVRTSELVRYVVDPERRQLVDRQTLDYRLMCDFPAVDPRLVGADYRDFWVLGISATSRPGRKFFDQVVHADWRAGTASDVYRVAPPHYLGGEPIFLPDPAGQRRGTVICQRFDAEREASAFLLFDALDVAAGPVATLHLRRAVHLGFHAAYAWDDS